MVSIEVGDIYWDCAYHPVLCTEADGDDVAGVSLIDGSEPRSCSVKHCGVTKLSPDQVGVLIKNRDLLITSENIWRDRQSDTAYATFKAEVEDSGIFPLQEE